MLSCLLCSSCQHWTSWLLSRYSIRLLGLNDDLCSVSKLHFLVSVLVLCEMTIKFNLIKCNDFYIWKSSDKQKSTVNQDYMYYRLMCCKKALRYLLRRLQPSLECKWAACSVGWQCGKAQICFCLIQHGWRIRNLQGGLAFLFKGETL